MGDSSYHHLYYSAHADPVAELEALTQSSLKLDATVTSNSGAHRVVTDSRLSDNHFLKWHLYNIALVWSTHLVIMPKN